ncbi:MAG: acetate--CoA ligase family protein, partial [Planctomycetota bacterium]
CEVILGAKALPGTGHALLCGLGGIHVELLKDVCMRLAPVGSDEARQMLAGLRTFPLLAGARGRPAVDIPALVELIQRVSQLVSEQPVIRELDLNPVFAFQQGVKVADARVML